MRRAQNQLLVRRVPRDLARPSPRLERENLRGEKHRGRSLNGAGLQSNARGAAQRSAERVRDSAWSAASGLGLGLALVLGHLTQPRSSSAGSTGSAPGTPRSSSSSQAPCSSTTSPTARPSRATACLELAGRWRAVGPRVRGRDGARLVVGNGEGQFTKLTRLRPDWSDQLRGLAITTPR